MSLRFHPLPLTLFEDKQRPSIARLNAELSDLFRLEATLSSSRDMVQTSDKSIVRGQEREVHVSRITPDIMEVVSGRSSVIGVPALTFSTANAIGTTTTVLAVDSTVAIFGTTAPLGTSDTAAVGTASWAARGDHVHPLAVGSSTLIDSLNAQYLNGLSSSQFLRSDADDTGTGTYTLSNSSPIDFTNSGTTTIRFGGGASNETLVFSGDGVNVNSLQVTDGTYSFAFGIASLLGGPFISGASQLGVISQSGDVQITANGGDVVLRGTTIEANDPFNLVDDSFTFGLGSGGGDPTMTWNGTTNDGTIRWDQVVAGGSPVFVLSHGIRALTVGDNTTSDPTITFDGASNDGTIVWDEDADEFVFADTIGINDSTTAMRFSTTTPTIRVGSGTAEQTFSIISTATSAAHFKFQSAGGQYLDIELNSAKAVLSPSTNVFSVESTTGSQSLQVVESTGVNYFQVAVSTTGTAVVSLKPGTWAYVGSCSFTTVAGALIANTALQTNGDFTIADAKNIVLNTTTGTMIGTAIGQKIGIWNTTPITQPSTTGHTSGYTAGSSGVTLQLDDGFNGGVGTKNYTVDDVVRHLKRWGVLAQS